MDIFAPCIATLAPGATAALRQLPLERPVALCDKSSGAFVRAEIRRQRVPGGHGFAVFHHNEECGFINYDVAQMGVHVGLVQSNVNHALRGVGSALMENAIRDSFNRGLDGRVNLEAVGSSHGFYLKQGFVCEEEEYALATYGEDLLDKAVTLWKVDWNNPSIHDRILIDDLGDALQEIHPDENVDDDFVRNYPWRGVWGRTDELRHAVAQAYAQNPAQPDTSEIGLTFFKLSDAAREAWRAYFASNSG